MSDRSLFRIGGVSAVARAVIGFVTNLLHPRTPDYSSPENLLRAVAESPIWVVDHLGLLVAILLTLGALVAISRSLTAGQGTAWARLGLAGAVVSTAVAVVLIGSDGIVAKAAATAWANAPAAERAVAFRIAAAVEQFDLALFSLFIVIFFGMTILLYGLAILTSAAYPQWLGWVAVLEGLASIPPGFIQAYNGPSVLVTNILFPIFSSIATVWGLLMGIHLWRKSHETVQAR